MTDVTRLEIELEDLRGQLEDADRELEAADERISELESEVSLLSTWQENTWPIVQTMATRSWVTVDGVCMMTHDGFCTPTLSPTGWVHSPTCWHERARTLLAANRNGE